MFRLLSALSVLLVLLLGSCAPTPPPAPPRPLEVPGAVDSYRTWVLAQADSLVVLAQQFADAVLKGDRATAKALYAPARAPYERIEPVAEALGDLDPRIDAREGDVPADEWTGFHPLEKLLWSDEPLAAGATLARTLAHDVSLLRTRVESAELTVPGLVTGAVELLNEVSTSKVTGEEERYSRTDLWDFQANVEGSRQIWSLLAPAVRAQDAPRADALEAQFVKLQTLLDAHRRGSGFQLYPELSADQVRALAAAVDAVAEPLSQLGGLIAGKS